MSVYLNIVWATPSKKASTGLPALAHPGEGDAEEAWRR